MADISELTITCAIETEGIVKANAELDNFVSSFIKLGKEAISTFRDLSKQLEILAESLQRSGQKISLFGIEFDVLKDRTGALEELSKAIDTFKETLVSGNEESIRSLAEVIRSITQYITNLEKTHPGFIKTITLVLGLTSSILLLIPVIAAVGKALAVVGGVLGLSAGWVLAVVAAVVLLTAALIDHEAAWNALNGVLKIFGDTIVSVIDFATGWIEDRFFQLVNFIKGLWEGLIKFLEEKVPFAKGIFDAIRSDAEDSRTKNEALFKSIKENQKNNPQIGGFQQLIKPDKATIQATEQTKQQSSALMGLSTANREAKKDIEKTNETLAQNGAANQVARGGVAGNAAALKDYGNTAGSTINPIEQLNDGLRDQITELQFQIDAVGKSGDELLELEAKQKLAEGASADLVTRWKELEKALDIAKKQEEFVGSIEDLIESTKEEIETLGLTGDELREYKIRALEAKLSTEEFTEEGLKKAQEELANLREETEKLNTAELAKKFEDLQFSLLPESDQERIKLQETLDFLDEFAKKRTDLEQEIADARVQVTEEANEKIRDLERKEYIQRLKDSGGFIDGIKAGFLEFVDQVENNSELISQFFADTLSQMSQNFSDLFFNVLTGKFDDLADLAKQAFEAILRAFLDLVSAIVTKQIVISIAGVFGFGKDKGGGGLDFAKQVFGIFEDAGSFFGTGSTAAGAAVAGAGGGVIASGAGLGGFAASGLGSVGTTTFGATSVFDVAAAGGGLTAVTAGTEAATTGLWATVSAALPWIGAALAAAALIVTFVLPLLKKTPKYAFKFESIETEVGERAATVAEFLDADLFSEEIFKTLSSHGGGGAFSGKEREELKKAIQKAIAETIQSVQDIINKLPADMAKILNEALLNTTVDTTSKIGRSNLLGFDAKGAKNIQEKLEKFFQGDLQGRFLFAIRDFFQIAFEQLGVLPDKAAAFIDTEFERFKNAKSPEERAQIGQEFLASFNAFVDAFNIVSGNVNDSIGQTIQSINSLSRKLGFDAVPSIGELTNKLGELLENAELDAETVQMYADLRNAIVQGISDIINSISGLIGKISQLNSTIVGLGGAAVNVIPFLDEAQAKLIEFYTTNIGNLSLGEQETFLDEILGIANAKLAEEQAAFQRAQAARQKAEEAQRARIEKRIDNLNKEKDKINEVFQKRIEALNEELQIAESFAQLTESIRQTLDSIVFSPESVLTGVEQVNALQSNITGLQAELAGTRDPERQIEIVGRLEEAFKTLFDTAGDAFGVNSPEFVAIFDQVTGGLESLAELTETRGRTVEEISAEIERLTAENEATLKSIDAKIEAAQERLASIGQSTADNTFRASQDLRELFEFIRSEYIRILEERFAELEEVSEFGFKTEIEGLGTIAQINNEQLTVLRSISDTLTSLQGFRRGTEGIKDFGRGTLAVLHGREAVVTEDDLLQLRTGIVNRFAAGLGEGAGIVERFAGRDGGGEGAVNEMHVDINVNVNGGSGAAASIGNEIENMLVRSIRQGGRLRSAIQEAGTRRMG